MQARQDEIRRETDRLLREAGERYGYYHIYCQAELAFTLLTTDYTNADWIRLAKIQLGKTEATIFGEAEIKYNQLAIESLLTIPKTEFPAEAKSLLAQCYYQYCSRGKHDKSIFPTTLARREYLDSALKVLSYLSFEGVRSSGFHYLACLQQMRGAVLVELYEYINAKSSYNAALNACRRCSSFNPSLLKNIYLNLHAISADPSLEKQLYHFATKVFDGEYLPSNFTRYFTELLPIHLAIVQQPYMHLTPAAHALLLLMQIIDQSLITQLRNQSLAIENYEPEKRAALKTLILKLAADLKPASLLKMVGESGGFPVGVALRLDELDRKIELASNQFAMFSQEMELSPPKEEVSAVSNVPAP